MKDSEKAKIVYAALRKRYLKPSRFVIPNIYFFDEAYNETDYLVVNKNDHIYDIEVKVSRADFKNDFKKIKKHEIIQTGKYTLTHDKFVLRPENEPGSKYKKMLKGESYECKMRPSRFYYAVPKGLLSLDEIPEYAGLLEIDLKTKKVTTVKQAPLLSKAMNRQDINNILVDKFYYRMKL